VAQRHDPRTRPYIDNFRRIRWHRAGTRAAPVCISAMTNAKVVPSKRGESLARILVAEDDPELRRMISSVLSYDGYDVVEVADGGSMLAYLRACDPALPDVIVSDICMPGCSGLDVLAELREVGLSAPFVLMTAFADQCSEAGARSLGAVTLVEKPFEIDDLRMIVMNLVPTRRRFHGAPQALGSAL
jgi:CheY-like chemotaxis protein